MKYNVIQDEQGLPVMFMAEEGGFLAVGVTVQELREAVVAHRDS